MAQWVELSTGPGFDQYVEHSGFFLSGVCIISTIFRVLQFSPTV